MKAMVRPRTGDFLYSTYEMAVMHADIQAFAALGVSGVVFGVLSADGTIDVDNTRSLVETALQYGLQVCFHRAFDMVVDQQEALRMLVTIPGITRILTSGGAPSATEGLSSLIQLCTVLPKPRIKIMPGSGVNPSTVGPLLSTLLHLDVRAVHLSGGRWVENELELTVEGGMQYRPKRMGMGVGGEGEWKVWRTREETVRAVRDIVDREWLAFSSTDT
ncbi:CutC family-domain-containing protein [Phellopilus nigrolimitatus]|nr:CutC family-domain-containing protein [Phellopilus nigrolimitatus]